MHQKTSMKTERTMLEEVVHLGLIYLKDMWKGPVPQQRIPETDQAPTAWADRGREREDDYNMDVVFA